MSDAYLDHHVVVDRKAVWNDRLAQPLPRQHVLVAEEAGVLIGFACVCLDEDPILGCLLDNIHVHPTRQAKGLGSRLLQAVADICVSSAPGSGLFLSVLEKNLSAQRFYYSHGAHAAGTEIWDAPDGHALACLRLAWRAGRLPEAGRPRLGTD